MPGKVNILSTQKICIVQAALFVYDEGLLGSDQELANALWRRFFLSMRDSEEKQVGGDTGCPGKHGKLIDDFRIVFDSFVSMITTNL